MKITQRDKGSMEKKDLTKSMEICALIAKINIVISEKEL